MKLTVSMRDIIMSHGIMEIKLPVLSVSQKVEGEIG